MRFRKYRKRKIPTCLLLAGCLSEEAYFSMIEKASLVVISQELPKIKKDLGENALHYILYYQHAKTALYIINNISTPVLSLCCAVLGPEKASALTYSITYQLPHVTAALLNKINDEALRYLLTHDDVSQKLFQLLLVILFLKKVGNTLI